MNLLRIFIELVITFGFFDMLCHGGYRYDGDEITIFNKISKHRTKIYFLLAILNPVIIYYYDVDNDLLMLESLVMSAGIAFMFFVTVFNVYGD